MRYDSRFFGQYGICCTNDNGGDENGGGGGNQQQQQQQKDPPWKSEFGDTFDADKAWEALQNSRKESRGFRSERDRLTTQLKERDDADKSETEKLRERLDNLEKENQGYKTRERETRVSRVVAEAASAAGAIYPEDVYALVSSQLEIDDNGEVRNAVGVIRELKSRRPALFDDGNVDQNQQNRQRGSNSAVNMNDLLRQGRR